MIKAIATGYRLLFSPLYKHPHKTIWGRLSNKKMGITSQVNCEEVIPMNSLNFTLLILLLILIEVKK